MATQVYTFHIVYEGLEKKIWRKVQVSSNYHLDQLGYLALAAFDTMAYHLSLNTRASGLNYQMRKLIPMNFWM